MGCVCYFVPAYKTMELVENFEDDGHALLAVVKHKPGLVVFRLV